MFGLSKHAPKSQLSPSVEIKADKLHKEESTRTKETGQLLKGFIRSFAVFVDVLLSGCTTMFVCVIFGKEKDTVLVG